MKTAIFALAILSLASAAQANPGDREVRVHPYPKHFVTGDIVGAGQIIDLLFTKERCSLPVADAKEMLRAWTLAGREVGCWYPMINGNYMFVAREAILTQASRVPWKIYPRGLLHDDGSVTITEPDYDSQTFNTKVMNEQMYETLSHRNERP